VGRESRENFVALFTALRAIRVPPAREIVLILGHERRARLRAEASHAPRFYYFRTPAGELRTAVFKGNGRRRKAGRSFFLLRDGWPCLPEVSPGPRRTSGPAGGARQAAPRLRIRAPWFVLGPLRCHDGAWADLQGKPVRCGFSRFDLSGSRASLHPPPKQTRFRGRHGVEAHCTLTPGWGGLRQLVQRGACKTTAEIAEPRTSGSR